MKKILILAALFICSIQAKATNFTFAIATLDSAYSLYSAYVIINDTDAAHIAQLGARPTNPIYDTTDAQWTAYVSSVYIYDSSHIALEDSFTVHYNIKRNYEVTVLTDIGCYTTLLNPPCNQWIKVQGGSFTTAWIGYYKGVATLKVVFVKPTTPFQ